MSVTDFDPSVEMVSFEAHHMAHEKGFRLELVEPDRLQFIKSENTPVGIVYTILDCAGAGAIGDPNEEGWTAIKKRHGLDRAYTSTVHDQTTLAKVLEKVDHLPNPTTREAGMDVYQSFDDFSSIENNGLSFLDAKFVNGPHKIVFEADYTMYHTGGGIFAFHKCHPDNLNAHYLITADDDGNLDRPIDEPVWVVGLYQSMEGHERWVFVAEGVTLQEVIEKAETLPMPDTFGADEMENTFETWAEVEALSPKPSF
jgi:hypothetical protein